MEGEREGCPLCTLELPTIQRSSSSVEELGVTVKDMGWAGAGGEGRGEGQGGEEEKQGKGEEKKGREGKRREGKGLGGGEGRRVLKGKERRREGRELRALTICVEHPTNRVQDCIS